MKDQTGEAIREAFITSSGLVNRRLAPANVVDAIGEAGRNVRILADAITPYSVVLGTDAEGGHVESLTEAVMGMTKALSRIADAVEMVAAAITDRRRS